MFSQIGPMEIVLVLVVALLILGPKRLPEAGRSLGRGIREFKDSVTHATSDMSLDGPLSVPEHRSTEEQAVTVAAGPADGRNG